MSDPVQGFRAAIQAALGYAPDTIEPGKLQRFAASEGRGDKPGWCKLFGDTRGGVFGCYRQGISETWRAFDRVAMTTTRRVEQARQVMAATAEREAKQCQLWADNERHNAELWAQCVPLVPGDPVTLYLKRRGMAGVWPLPACMRLHRALPHWHDGKKLGAFPAMLAPLVALDGRTVALHRTYLCADGRKADVPTVKKLTGASGPLAGACVPLYKPKDGVIGIAEGIETALAAWCASAVPTVAAYCAANLAAWRWPAGVRRLVIFADHDKAGADAAAKLRLRARTSGLAVNVMTPTEPGSDWCDVWAQRAAVRVEAGAA